MVEKLKKLDHLYSISRMKNNVPEAWEQLENLGLIPANFQ